MAEQDQTKRDAIDPAGSRELARALAAWLACVAFAVTFLVATMLAETSMFTAVVRGGIAAFACQQLGPWLLRPAVTVVIEAMARDRAVRVAATSEQEDGGE